MLGNFELRWYQRTPRRLRFGPPAPVLQYRVATLIPAQFGINAEQVEWSKWQDIPLVQQWREKT